MDTLEAIKKRRAVKHYDANYTIPQKDIDLLLEHAVDSPTSL